MCDCFVFSSRWQEIAGLMCFWLFIAVMHRHNPPRCRGLIVIYCGNYWWGWCLVTIGLSAILWLTQSLRFIEITVNKGASLAFFFKLTILILPNFLTVILPVSLFSVVLFTFHKMISDREIIALRAAGVSHIVLARPGTLSCRVSNAGWLSAQSLAYPPDRRGIPSLAMDITHSRQ